MTGQVSLAGLSALDASPTRPATTDRISRVEKPPSFGWHPSACSQDSRHEGLSAEQLLDDVRRAMERNPEATRAAVSQLVTFLTPPAAVEPASARGGLAPWQKRKVDRYLRENLDRPVRLNTVAEQVALSVSYFSRAFKETFGTTPHMHMLRLRLELAQRTDADNGRPAKSNRARVWPGRSGAPFEALPTCGRRDPKRLASSKPHRCSSRGEKPPLNQRPIRICQTRVLGESPRRPDLRRMRPHRDGAAYPSRRLGWFRAAQGNG